MTKAVYVTSEVPIGGDFRAVVIAGQAFWAYKSRVLAQWHPVEMRWVPSYGLMIAVSHHD